MAPAAADKEDSGNDAEELAQSFVQMASPPDSDKEVTTPRRSARQRLSPNEKLATVATPKKRKRTTQAEDQPTMAIETRARRRQQIEDSPNRGKLGRGKGKARR
jgi:hypothetical protein